MPKIYSQAFKDETVKFYERGHSLSETLEKYGISQSSLFAWKNDFLQRNPTYIGHAVDLRDDHKISAHMEKMDLIFEVMQKVPCGMNASIDEKMKAVDSLSDQYSIHVLCEALNLSRGTYYNRKRRETYQTASEIRDEELKPLIEKVFWDSKGRFGRKPIHHILLKQGVRVSEKHIARLMSEMGLTVDRPKYMAQHLQALPRHNFKDLLQRQFHQVAPNLVWVSDITYVKVDQRYFYICVIIDLFSRMVLSYKISDKIDADLVMQTFDYAFVLRGRPSGLIMHSDQGTQYTAFILRKHLRDLNVSQSFSHAGSPLDNAVCESFMHVMKIEAIYHHMYSSPAELAAVLDEYISFYNRQRPHRKLSMMTPVEFESEFYSFNA